MKCPHCNYLMSAFESDCPKCQGQGIAPVAPAGLPATPPPSPVAPTVGTNGAPLVFCSSCGQQHLSTARICTRCKTPLALQSAGKERAKDSPSLAMALVGFILPIGGILIWMLQHNEYEERAASAGKGALVGIFVGIVGFIIAPYLPELLKSLGY